MRLVAAPEPRGALAIPGLVACADGVQAATIDPAKPVHVLVHGCNSSAGRFQTLARVFEASGQQTVCFNYEDRDPIEKSSGELIRALEALAARLTTREIVVLGHSQGGLVTRRALVEQRSEGLKGGDLKIRMVTVSSPFAGIQASAHCSSVALHVVSFGLSTGICHLVTGMKWLEIHPRARRIREPGTLVPAVVEHLKVVTDESDSCRQAGQDGRCAKSDFVFSLPEQYQPVVDGDARVANRVTKAGHVEIVGETGAAPVKLIQILQDEGVLATPPAGQQQAFAERVRRLYQ